MRTKKYQLLIIYLLFFPLLLLERPVMGYSEIPPGNTDMYAVKQDTTYRAIALTFDDGPHLCYTPRILDELKKLNVKASFFLVGKLAMKHPEIVRRIHEEGHTVCNHSYNHWNMKRLSYSRILFEWRLCNEIIEKITGSFPEFCRPPGGNYNNKVLKAADHLGLIPVFWNINSEDCSGISAEKIVRRVTASLEPGSVILLHDGFENTLLALPSIVAKAKSQGYSFVTLHQLFRNF